VATDGTELAASLSVRLHDRLQDHLDTRCRHGGRPPPVGPTLCQGGTILMSLNSDIYDCKIFGPYPETRGRCRSGSRLRDYYDRGGENRTPVGIDAQDYSLWNKFGSHEKSEGDMVRIKAALKPPAAN